MRFFAFDSFEGLPSLTGADRQTRDFVPGKYRCSQDGFTANLRKGGLPLERVKVVPGWFDEVLNQRTIARFELPGCDRPHRLRPLRIRQGGAGVPHAASERRRRGHLRRLVLLQGESRSWRATGLSRVVRGQSRAPLDRVSERGSLEEQLHCEPETIGHRTIDELVSIDVPTLLRGMRREMPSV